MSERRIEQSEIPTVPMEEEDFGFDHRIEMGISSIIGTRKNQQDTVFGNTDELGTIAVVCDGMGGLEGGEIASCLAAQTLAEDYFQFRLNPQGTIPDFFQQEAIKIDSLVYELQNEEGDRLEAGTTMSAVIVEGNRLHWLSVGDSRIYLIREKKIQMLNQEHNYREMLLEKLERGEITEEYFYEEERERGEALVSFLGIGDLSLMDINQRPFLLQEGDFILLCSDGLYRSMPEEMILKVILDSLPDVERAAFCLTAGAMDMSWESLDNTSLILLQYFKWEETIQSEQL